MDKELPQETLVARSLDGGETWRVEQPANLGPGVLRADLRRRPHVFFSRLDRHGIPCPEIRNAINDPNVGNRVDHHYAAEERST